MPIRRGEEYLESLRDGRRVWLMGQRVEDVTTHPALSGCACSVAAVYDLQHDPVCQELLTMPSPTTGGWRGGPSAPASGNGRYRAV
jgi:aromatic ring hydroxylase